eukprot:696355-Pyramimonas_sp.AAC.1
MPLLGPSRGSLGPSGGPLWSSRGLPRPSWGSLGGLTGRLGTWAVFDGVRTKKASMLNMHTFLWEGS